MWIVMNDSFISVVKDRHMRDGVVARARVREDLERLFPTHVADVIETEDSDYRFRLFLMKEHVADVIRDRILDIEYDNFKNSVKEGWRKTAYTRIWGVMYDVQEQFYQTVKKWQHYR